VPVGLYGSEATNVDGNTVVEMDAVEEMIVVMSAGQSVIVGAQLIIVTMRVV
jgi:hypothetical protein